MRVVISGSGGLVGRQLASRLVAEGHEVVRLVRSPGAVGPGDAAPWRPERGELDPAVLDGADAVVNLNGRSIADGRWSAAVKADLRRSRLDATRTLVQALATGERPPRVLVNASATGYYGDRGDEVLDEGSARGTGFLADLAADWEAAAEGAAELGVRVVRLRLGMVVGRGGALARMLPPFRLGLGGPLGSGRQFWPWIGMDDVLGVIRFAIDRGTLAGPVNVVSPEPLRCKGFVTTLGKVLRRPAFLPAPSFALRLALGEMADGLLLGSARVLPRRLADEGYVFRTPDLADAIRRAVD